MVARRALAAMPRRRRHVKFTVLIPTRNRLEYLKLAVESVRRQDYEDWELVISDNRSDQPIGEYVASLADERIVYSRSEESLPVTENWNRALDLSHGDYVLMLGDDDALLPGYFRRMARLTERFDAPDAVYTKAVLLTYPGVDPARPQGFLQDLGCAGFFTGRSEPFVLDRASALGVVKAAMGFRLRFDFNAQFALFSRSLIDAVRRYGPFYQSDFPDYYSMNSAFLAASKIVVEPAPRVLIGVTPKSYGYFHVNSKEDEGREFLAGGSAERATGTNINVGWLSAVTAVERGIGREHGLRVNRRRYRFVQAAYVYERFISGRLGREEVRRLEREMPPLERWAYRIAAGAVGLVYRLLPESARLRAAQLGHRTVGQIPAVPQDEVDGRFKDALEVFEASARDPAAGPVAAALRQ
jgi:glycosyltransferase involved in cell wall biosynthesis